MDSGDYKEGYYIGVEVPDNDSNAKKPFYGPNVWPSTDILPGWRRTMEKYHREALEVAKAIARLIALALDLVGNFFYQQEMLGKPIAMLRLLHYEGLISNPTKGLYGAGAHSNFGLLPSWPRMMLLVSNYASIRMPNLRSGNMWHH
ncbi:unnamed protein product [Ilex paraguariensis]|uniref:Uncharacterized protein n=1 Tax=Ilex paraguariensis TaxID=185542 RepID=A0ABC8RW78_9AQUA